MNFRKGIKPRCFLCFINDNSGLSTISETSRTKSGMHLTALGQEVHSTGLQHVPRAGLEPAQLQ